MCVCIVCVVCVKCMFECGVCVFVYVCVEARRGYCVLSSTLHLSLPALFLTDPGAGLAGSKFYLLVLSLAVPTGENFTHGSWDLHLGLPVCMTSAFATESSPQSHVYFF